MSTLETNTPIIEQDPAGEITRIPVQQLPEDSNVIAFPVRVEPRPAYEMQEHVESDPAVELDGGHIAYRAAGIALETEIENVRELKDREAVRQARFLGDSRDRAAERKSERAFDAVEGLVRPAGVYAGVVQSKKLMKLEQRREKALENVKAHGPGHTRSHGRTPARARTNADGMRKLSRYQADVQRKTGR